MTLHGTATGDPLSAVSQTLVGDVADVVWIETLGSTPLIVDRFARVKARRLPSNGNPLVDRSDLETATR